MHRISIQTTLLCPQAAVWDRISTMHGVNDELYPILRMTCPDMSMRISKELVNVHQKPLFRSWLLLFGILPIEYDDINLKSVLEGQSFSERSEMALMSEWHHDRFLETDAAGTVVTDNLAFSPRFGMIGWLLVMIVKCLFQHRHRRLKTIFGCAKDTKWEIKSG